MAQADFGTGKSLVILAVVLGCFAILWPKIFYPMMQTAFAMTSPKVDADGRFRDTDRPPHLHPASVNPRGRGPVADDAHDKFMMREGRPFPHPQVRQPVKAQPKSGGAMSIIMPIYTIGIVVFFLYTVLKLVFKKPNENDKKPLIKDFHMDPEYSKFVCQQPEKISGSQINKPSENKMKQSDVLESTVPENAPDSTKDMDAKDYEIFKLRKKLEETEQAMERIIKHMGVVNACLNERVKLEKEIDTKETDVRQRRRKGSSKAKQEKTKKTCIQDEDKLNRNSVNALEEDLAELINLCNITDKSIKSQSANYIENVSDEANEKEEFMEGTDSEEEFEDDHAQLISEEKCSANGHGQCNEAFA